MNQALRVLMVEDSKADVTILLLALRGAGYDVAYAVVQDPVALRAALERQDWDVVTSDHSMPRFSALAALALAREVRPHLPFIVVSGDIDPDMVTLLLKSGVADYVQKRDMSRLIPAVERELRRARTRHGRQQPGKAPSIGDNLLNRNNPSPIA